MLFHRAYEGAMQQVWGFAFSTLLLVMGCQDSADHTLRTRRTEWDLLRK